LNEVLITATASVTGLGPDLDTTWRRLLAGETAVRPIRRFDTSRYPARNASWIEGLNPVGTGPFSSRSSNGCWTGSIPCRRDAAS
jgi:3-oxoacyl-(acyl-carrier-protein) synthase